MRILILLLCVTLFLSCRKSNDPVTNFCNYFEATCHKDEIDAFRKTPRDSVSHEQLIFYKRFDRIYHDTILIKELSSFFNHIDPDRKQWHYLPNFAENYIVLALHSKLNHGSFDENEIFCETLEKIQREEEDELLYNKLSQIEQRNLMFSNYRKCKVGDKFDIVLPVESQQAGGWYKSYIATFDRHWRLDDSVILRVELLHMVPKCYYNVGDTVEIKFNLKLLKTSNPDVRISDKKFKVGNNFELSLYFYGRPIKVLNRSHFLQKINPLGSPN